MAGERGARAILFDITDDKTAADQLRKPRGLSQPVVLIWGHDAELLMGVVNKNREAHVKIEVKEPPAWPDYDVWILLTVVSTVIVIVLIFVILSLPSSQDSLQQQTMQAISQLATRTYPVRCQRAPLWDSASSCSSAPVCAICLEEFSEGQELRIISCSHEFHRECVDPWLQQHHTCPLCMFNILAGRICQALGLRGGDLELGQRLHLFRQHPGHALYHFSQVYAQSPRSFSSHVPHGNPFFHSPELSQLDFNTMHYMPYRPAGPMPTCSHQPPLAQSLLIQQHRKPPACGQTPSSHRTCPLHHGRQQNSSGSGESYLTEHSGYLADGPGSDSSSGPCHGSSSDSMLNCTDVSLQGIHGSCSTFRSSLSSDYDPLVYCSEGPTTDYGQDQPPPPREPRPRSLDFMVTGSAALPQPQILSHIHYHHHRHHHYRKGLECPSGRPGQDSGQRKSRYSGAKVGLHSAQIQKKAEKVRHYPQHLESISLPQDALLSGQPSCLQQRHDPSKTPSLSADQSDFSKMAIRPVGAAGSFPFQLSQKYSLQSRHHRRKKKCHLEPSLAHLPEDSDMHKTCNVHIHYGQPSGSSCSQEVQPLMSSAPLPYSSGSQVVWKCLVPHPNSEPQQPRQGLSEQETKPIFPGPYLQCQALQHNQGKFVTSLCSGVGWWQLHAGWWGFVGKCCHWSHALHPWILEVSRDAPLQGALQASDMGGAVWCCLPCAGHILPSWLPRAGRGRLACSRSTAL
uniref:RING-type E3 ubiquitin transferase n=1 Tax=Crocodylus porosus TaxID=8502 RepID=A0A7M4EKP7_CROPO